MGSLFEQISPREFMKSIVGKSLRSYATVRSHVMETNTTRLATSVHFMAKTRLELCRGSSRRSASTANQSILVYSKKINRDKPSKRILPLAFPTLEIVQKLTAILPCLWKRSSFAVIPRTWEHRYILTTVSGALSGMHPTTADANTKVDGVLRLVDVEADLTQIPLAAFPKKMGADGCLYYRVKFNIEVTCYSAYTKYELVHDGKNYGPVRAEYV